MIPLAIIGILLLLALLSAQALIRRRNAHIWLPAYIAGRRERRARARTRAGAKIVHVLFAFVDHFEPVVKPGQDPARKKDAIPDWMQRYPALCERHRDSDGRPPRHTWTYPLETYQPDNIDRLVELCRSGLGEIEVHLHHRDDTSDTLRAKMLEGLGHLAEHGVSTVQGVDGYRFAFVHGNWSLDNSLPDGSWCGVNDELTLLGELGCFADVTLPSAPSPAQTHKINSIYYATDDPDRPKSHDTGVDVEVGRQPSGELMIIQGPLAPDRGRRKLGIVPRIDNGAITGAYPGTPQRIDAWVDLGIGVIGRPDWVFVKVHCHGANTCDREAVLGEGADAMFSHLEAAYGSGHHRLHYVTVREMYNIIKAAEAGRTGDPADFRDLEIPPYVCIDAPPNAGHVSK